MEPLLKFWPSLLGVFILTLCGILFWPKAKSVAVWVGHSSDDQEQLQAVEASKAKLRPKDLDEQKGSAPPAPQAQIIIEETTVPVLIDGQDGRSLKAEDQDVQAALAEVEIELYEAEGCVDCEKAAEFFKENKLKFVRYDVEKDFAHQEKARRLSRQTGIPVIVIDGVVSVDFSEARLSEQLSAAVERRVLAPKN